jgi:hypothetical protein
VSAIQHCPLPVRRLSEEWTVSTWERPAVAGVGFLREVWLRSRLTRPRSFRWFAPPGAGVLDPEISDKL